MKCLVFSDSHGNSYYLEQALSMHRDAEAVFFLGDGLADIASLVLKYEKVAWLYVRGNCDAALPILPAQEKIGRITLYGKKIFYTHGDLFNVKYGMESVEDFAKSNGAAAFIFGHTHKPHESYKDGIYYFNPGSIGTATDGFFSYGIMQISEKGLLFSHGRLPRY